METSVNVIPTISIVGTPTEAESSGASFISQPVESLKRQHSQCDEMGTKYLLAGKDVIDTGLFISLVLHLVKIQVAKGTSSPRPTWAGGSDQEDERYASVIYPRCWQDRRIPFYSMSSDEDEDLFSSPGIHTSRLPLRLESKAEVDIVTSVPQQTLLGSLSASLTRRSESVILASLARKTLCANSGDIIVCRIVRLEVLRRRYGCMWHKGSFSEPFVRGWAQRRRDTVGREIKSGSAILHVIISHRRFKAWNRQVSKR